MKKYKEKAKLLDGFIAYVYECKHMGWKIEKQDIEWLLIIYEKIHKN